MKDTILWQRLEGLAVFAAALVYFANLDSGLPIWAAVLIFFAPDLSFAAYAGGPRIGAFAYNLVHVYALGAVLMVAGLLTANVLLTAIGVLILGHTGFDRALGYGLKSTQGFKCTHLGHL